MDWKYGTKIINQEFHKIIQDADTGDVIAVVDNLDREYVQDIIDVHNKTVRLARKEGVDIVKEVYKSKK